MNTGNLFRKQRQVKGYSQEYVAIQLGISKRTYVNIENNKSKLDLEKFILLAVVLDINPLDLFQDYINRYKFEQKVDFRTQNNKLAVKFKQEIIEKETIIHYLESKLNLK